MIKYMCNVEGVRMEKPTELLSTADYERAVLSLKENRKKLSAIGILKLKAIILSKKETVAVIALKYGVTPNTVRNWIKSFKRGDIKTTCRVRRGKINDFHLSLISEWLNKDYKLTSLGVAKRLEEICELTVNPATVRNAIKSLCLPRRAIRKELYSIRNMQISLGQRDESDYSFSPKEVKEAKRRVNFLNKEK